MKILQSSIIHSLETNEKVENFSKEIKFKKTNGNYRPQKYKNTNKTSLGWAHE